MSEIPVAWTKIVVPGRRADLLHRRRLVELFYELLDNRLIIVAAPAGYGKTTLLVDISHEVEMPTCWFSLDELDDSPRRFLAGFIAALARQFPEFGKEASATLQEMSKEIDWDRMVTVLVNDAYHHIGEHFLFVVDDYHYVDDNSDIVYFLNHFVQQVDENCHLALLTRRLPALPDLPLMVARSQVGGLGFQMLAFQRQELQELLLQNYGLTIQDVEAHHLLEQTEGWITGLLLSAQTMDFQLGEQSRLTRVVGVDLYDYLAQQVLARQTEPMQQFLLHTSLLDAFDAELCAAVLEPASYLRTRSWQSFINDALQRNLFIQAVDERAGWVRYHQLFREFLRSEMQKRDPQAVAQIRMQLAAVYAQQGKWERAHHLYEALGDFEGLAAVIEQAGVPMTYAGRQSTLARWLDELPQEVVEARPELLSLRGMVAVDLGEAERGIVFLNAAHAAALEQGDDVCRARTLVRRAYAHRFLGNGEVARDDAQAALALIGDDETLDDVRASARRVLALALFRNGHTQEAIEALEESRSLQRLRGNMRLVAVTGVDLGRVYLSAGAYRRAQAAFEESLRGWRELGNIGMQANLLNNLGVIAHALGNYEEAGALFEEAVGLAEERELERHLALAKASIGDLYSDLDAFDAALAAYQEAHAIALSSDYHFLQHYLALTTATIARRQGDYARAERLLRRARSGGRSADWQLEVGELAAERGDRGAALANLAEAAERYEEQQQEKKAAVAWLALAGVQWHSGQEEAAAALERALALVLPEMPQALVVRARSQIELLKALAEAGDPLPGVEALLAAVERFEEQLPTLRRVMRRTMAAVPFAPPRLRIRLLGETEVSIGGKEVTRSDWQTPMAPALLYLLLAHPDGLTKEEIGLYLWPDHSPGRLKVNFQKTIYRLRRALVSEAVVYDEETKLYRFNQELDYTCDVERFRLHLMEARTSNDPQERKAAYRAALELYRGPYLADEDETWAASTREALAEAYREAALDLAELYLEEGAYTQVLALCRSLLVEDPCLEEAHRLAMRAHAGRGNMAGVVRQYQRCQRVLEEEIRVAPSHRTVELYHSLTGAV